MLTEAGAIKVMDFGIARVAGTEHLTNAGFMMGTPAYMAPEQVMGKDIDARADLYAAGVLLVEMVTGVHPFATGAIPREPLPPSLKAIADRCLSRDPKDRYASARELLAGLEAAQRAGTGEAAVAAPSFSPRWWWEFHQAVAALVYWLMLIPVWSARGLIGGLTGRTVFVVTLAAVIVAANMRLHRWFTSRFFPAELRWVRGRTRTWIAAGDWLFALSLIAAGLIIGDERTALAIVLLSFGLGTAVVFLFVEPVTERAAFKPE